LIYIGPGRRGRFCEDCGTALAGNAAPAATSSPQAASTAPDFRVTPEQPADDALEGERKTVTALFADIKGSTELMRDLEPEEARAIVDPVLQLMMAAVHRYGGYVAQSTGDGIFALFGAPVAHEDHPQRALHAALAMQKELRRYADRMRAEGKIPVEARIGVNTGEVMVRTIETFRLLQLQWLRRYWKMELHDALELADELLATAEEVKDPAMLLTSNSAANMVCPPMPVRS
jgi:class 3 adenylate cyclase